MQMNDNDSCNENKKKTDYREFEVELSTNTSELVNRLKNQLKLETKIQNEFHRFSAKFSHSVNN